MITNWNHKFQWIEPLVVIIEEACENWSVLVCKKIEKFGIISVADVKNFIVKPSLDVESITEDVSSLRLEKNKVLCFSGGVLNRFACFVLCVCLEFNC